MKIVNRSKAKNGPERSVFAFKHDTVNLSFMYTVPLYWSEVNDLINHRVRLTKEVAGLDQQKKQFQLTGLDTMEVMDDMFSI